MLAIGFKNFVMVNQIIAIISYSNAAKKIVKSVLEKDQLKGTSSIIDASCGRKKQSLIILEGNKFAISTHSSSTLANKLGLIELQDSQHKSNLPPLNQILE